MKKPEEHNYSIIIPWKYNVSRELLLNNLLNCLGVQKSNPLEVIINFEIIIVEQIHTNSSINIIPETLKDRCIHVKLKSNELFNKSWCMNVGARKAKHDNIIFMDADSLFGSDYLFSIKFFLNGLSDKHKKIIFCWDNLVGLPGKDNPITRYIKPDMTCAMGGIWYIQKKFYFETLGGMNENYFGYGGEDNDFWERAVHFLKFHPKCLSYTLVHQYHDWEIAAENAVKYFEKTRSHPEIVTERLKVVGIGKEDRPSLIMMDDLS